MLTEFTKHPQKVLYPYNTYRAICKEVYDGDTFTMLVDLGFYTYTTIRVRLLNVDTPEMNDKDPVKREAAQAAKDRAVQLLLDKPCIITTLRDKQSFDRWIAHVEYYNESMVLCSLAQTLLSEGLALPYIK
jgi:micrococcal nuclease